MKQEQGFRVEVIDHRLNIAQQCPSPNHNLRPNGEVSLLVLHNISLPPKQYGGAFVEDFFQNKLDANAHPYFRDIAQQKVSSHLFIRRDGTVIQFVPFHLRAWHAGRSCYSGREDCNDFSIGVEIEGCDDEDYTHWQYEVLKSIVNALMTAYPAISKDRITGHQFIAPGRKTDPGLSFKWQRLFMDLNC